MDYLLTKELYTQWCHQTLWSVVSGRKNIFFLLNGNKIILMMIMKQLEGVGFHLALTLRFESIAEIAHDFMF